MSENRTLIIAEVGVNHNGELALAERIARAAIDAGTDVVKFHAYKTEEIMTAATPLADYMSAGLTKGQANGEKAFNNFFDMAKKYELSDTSERSLKAMIESLGAEFLSSPFDVSSVFALRDLGVKRLKIPSGELVNPLLLRAAAATGLPLIVSTGMADLEETRYAVETLRAANSGPITLLHCVSQYPAEFRHVNLKAIETLRTAFPGIPIGYSDHTPGIAAAIAAVALGATVIEKHLTISRALPGPDQSASLEPDEFAAMVKAIRDIEIALGDGRKHPTPPEMANRPIVRKSLVTRSALKKGHALTADDLTAKRPGDGLPARDFDAMIGKTLRRDLPANAQLALTDLN